MTFRVKRKHDPFIRLRSEIPGDKSLSYEALGLLVYMVSAMDGWTFTYNDLKRGDTNITALVNELIQAGYVLKDSSGGYTISEEPMRDFLSFQQPMPDPEIKVPLLRMERRLQPQRDYTVTDRDSTESKSLSSSSAELTELGGRILGLMKDLNSRSQRLTFAQAEQLKLNVFVDGVMHPSPESEYSKFPNEFDLFLTSLPEMPYIKKMREGGSVSAGMIIKAIRGYHFNSGWFAFRPGTPYQVESPEYEDWQRTLYGLEDESEDSN